ncbi:hypothetical protein AK812_SmicGene43235 [Symbiodinium microadriaticum]|uniref:Uncharacterized protein n=1 Tax=Symbiodinium microadriaticum TaxID=2951 RepID=A0A1Q9C1J0_SYMMI|nr:hypothetical protein AK812_SmicGene43235 [Symbiodinium microadriaticum]
MLPMSAHGVASFGCNIFYALGHEVCGGEEDEYNIARVLYNTSKSAKNLASVAVGGKAWGSLRKVYGGSVETARVATEEDEVLKDSNAKAYCVSRNRYSFNYIAFEQLAQPPSTARGLINQYLRAANLKSPGRQAHPTWNLPQPPSETPPLRRLCRQHHGRGLLPRAAPLPNLRQIFVQLEYQSRPASRKMESTTTRHWSSNPRGMEEYGLRPLSHGRFTGIILTRNVAETVLLSQIQKKLREDNIDVDATIEAIYKSRNLKPPDKVKEATKFVAPLVEEIFSAMKPWTQAKNYGKNSEQDNQVAQRMQELEEEAAKYKQRLKSAGVTVTPTKVLPLQPAHSASSAPSDSQRAPSPTPQPLPTSAPEDPPSKRRRTQRTDKKKQYESLLEEPYNIIKQSGQQPPTSMTSIKTWVTNLKKTLDKHKELDQHIQHVHTLLEEGKHTKAQLQEMATRWGLPISLITATAASPRTLQQLFAAVTFLAV